MLQLDVMREKKEPSQWLALAVSIGVVYLLDVYGVLPVGDLTGPPAALRVGLFYGGGIAAGLAIHEVVRRIRS